MIQLSFEPAFDTFHTAYRILRQIRFDESRSVEVERLKIIDVFVLEPQRCVEIRLSGALRASARKASTRQKPLYGRRPNTQALFNNMRPIQDAAIQTLVQRGLIDSTGYGEGFIRLGSTQLDAALALSIDASNEEDIDLMRFLCIELDEIPLRGLRGLKDRTGLGEYRYDVV